MAVIGGIVGAGIFINPYLVAQRVPSVPLILAAWIAGGVIALLGAWIYAELAARAPVVGGQYAYLREALHPAVAFIYGWVLLLVIQTGGMAAVAMTFARYFTELTQWEINDSAIAAAALAGLTIVNCLGVAVGSRVQSAMTLSAVLVIATLECCSAFAHAPAQLSAPGTGAIPTAVLPLAFGSAMTPVLFAYGGWQTSSFLGAEVRDARKILPRALILGVGAVIILYTSINYIYLRELGPIGLAQTTTPASAVMRKLLGPSGARFVAAGISLSTLGFLAQSVLTAPRVYFAMAADGVFFRSVAWVHPRTRVPVVAIALQGICAMIIALSGTYAQVVNYVVAMDCVFIGLTAICLFVMRGRETRNDVPFRVPGHPWTTITFIAAQWLVVLSTFIRDPIRSCVGAAIGLAGLPFYWLWSRSSKYASVK